MKRINLFLSLLAIFAIVVSSCDNEGETLTPPTIKAVESGTNTYLPGDTVRFAVAVATDNGDLTTISATSVKATAIIEGTTPSNKWDFDKSQFVSGTYSATVNYAVVISTTANEKDQISVKFTVTDEEGETNDDIVDIIVGSAAPVITMNTYTGVGLSYTSTTLADNCMFNAATGTSLNANGTAADMDFAYAWQNTYGYSIVSPNAAWLADLWSVNGITYTTADKNTTKFQAYTAKAYADITVDDLNDLTIATSTTVVGGGNGIQGLANGDLVAFITDDGYKGVVEFNSLAKVTKTCTVNVKVVAPASDTK